MHFVLDKLLRSSAVVISIMYLSSSLCVGYKWKMIKAARGKV